MLSNRFFGIRQRIALLVVACLLPAWLATAFFTVENYRKYRDGIESTNLAAAKNLMLVFERELASVTASLQTLATSPSIDKRDLAALEQQMRQVMGFFRGINVLFIDLDGQQLINTARPAGLLLPKEKHSKLMLQVLATGQPSATDLFYGPVVKKHLVAVVVPVLREGQVTAFLSLAMDAANLAAILDLQSYPAKTKVSVFDSVGNIIAESAATQENRGRKAPADLLSTIKMTPQGIVVTTVSGVANRVAYHRSTKYGWTSSIALTDDFFSDELVSSLWLELAAALTLLAVSLALANWIGRSIAKPIQALVAPALALGQGQAFSMVPLNLVEADAVGRALLATQALLLQREQERNLAHDEAMTDGLTGLANRRRFDEVLESEWSRAMRAEQPLALAMIDVDWFKKYNDHYGHLAGDECLRCVAKLLADKVRRGGELVARYGGEEFVLIAPATDGAAALIMANTFCQAIEALALPHQLSAFGHVTISIGVAALIPGKGQTPESLVKLADDTLYRAKHEGKNRALLQQISADADGVDPLAATLVELVWKDAYCCGNALIDAQHRELFHAANQLLSAMLTSGNAEEISKMIKQLLAGVARHFHDEEEILQQLGFAGLAHHALDHAQLLQRGQEIERAFEEKTLSAGGLFQFLAYDVVVNHMLGADRQYAALIAGAS